MPLAILADLEQLRAAHVALELAAIRVRPLVGPALRDMVWSLDRDVDWSVSPASPRGQARAHTLHTRSLVIAQRADGMTYHAEPVARAARALAELTESGE